MTTMTITPEHDKLVAVRDEHRAIQNFINWLEEKEGNCIAGRYISCSCLECPACRTEDGERIHMEVACTCGCDWTRQHWYTLNESRISKLIAEYFEIDLEAFDNEKRALLESLR